MDGEIGVEPFIHRQKRYMEIVEWQQNIPHLIAGMSTRLEGRSNSPFQSLNLGLHVGDKKEDVIENRKLLAKDLRFPLSQWVCAEQVHHCNIYKVSSLHAGRGATSLETAIRETDGLYTFERGILLTCVFADCVPLFFLANVSGKQLIGLAHAGWRGTVKKIGPRMIEQWKMEEGVPLENIQVVIGPSISKNKYEVDQKVIDAVDECLTEGHVRPYDKNENGSYLLDLRMLNKLLLIQAGLREDQISISSICTATDKRMFSHRHEGGKTGRMIGFIGLR